MIVQKDINEPLCFFNSLIVFFFHFDPRLSLSFGEILNLPVFF